MSKKMLQVEFTVTVPFSEVAPMFDQAAKAIADVPGLKWKFWLVDEKEKRGGGMYLFEDDASLDAYLAGPIIAQLRSHPGFANLAMKRWDVIDELTRVTRGPMR